MLYCIPYTTCTYRLHTWYSDGDLGTVLKQCVWGHLPVLRLGTVQPLKEYLQLLAGVRVLGRLGVSLSITTGHEKHQIH